MPILVAINKIDKPGANPERVMTELTEYGLTPEEWGGDTIYTKISALNGTGVEELLENNRARSAKLRVIEKVRE